MRIALVVLLVSIANPAFAIKKCKDTDGNWHYGDIAVAECENSKVTTLNSRGFITDELDAPLTADEIQAAKDEVDQAEVERMQVLAAAEEKRRVLAIYETEADIDRQRDNKLSSLQGNIDVHNAYLKGMDSRIARFEKKLAEIKGENAREKYVTKIQDAHTRVKDSQAELTLLYSHKQEILDKFAKEKEVYLGLKNSD